MSVCYAAGPEPDGGGNQAAGSDFRTSGPSTAATTGIDDAEHLVEFLGDCPDPRLVTRVVSLARGLVECPNVERGFARASALLRAGVVDVAAGLLRAPPRSSPPRKNQTTRKTASNRGMVTRRRGCAARRRRRRRRWKRACDFWARWRIGGEARGRSPGPGPGPGPGAVGACGTHTLAIAERAVRPVYAAHRGVSSRRARGMPRFARLFGSRGRARSRANAAGDSPRRPLEISPTTRSAVESGSNRPPPGSSARFSRRCLARERPCAYARSETSRVSCAPTLARTPRRDPMTAAYFSGTATRREVGPHRNRRAPRLAAALVPISRASRRSRTTMVSTRPMRRRRRARRSTRPCAARTRGGWRAIEPRRMRSATTRRGDVRERVFSRVGEGFRASRFIAAEPRGDDGRAGSRGRDRGRRRGRVAPRLPTRPSRRERNRDGSDRPRSSPNRASEPRLAATRSARRRSIGWLTRWRTRANTRIRSRRRRGRGDVAPPRSRFPTRATSDDSGTKTRHGGRANRRGRRRLRRRRRPSV